ncbi:MAG: hypothetical protein LOD92_10680 [Bacillales bacterium]
MNIRLIGIELVASLFEADDVPVSLIAGVATAEPVRQMLLEKLKTSESMQEHLSKDRSCEIGIRQSSNRLVIQKEKRLHLFIWAQL